MEKAYTSLYGFAERNKALLMTIRAEEGIDLIKEYLDKTEFRDEAQLKWIRRRVPDLQNFFLIFGELLSQNEKQKFVEILKPLKTDNYNELDRKDLDKVSITLRRFSGALVREQQKGFELLKKLL